MARLYALWLEMAATLNQAWKFLDQRICLQQKDPQQHQHSRSKANCTAVCGIFPLVILEHIHTKAPWHEEMSPKRDCCCTRGGPRCAVARWPGDNARGARWPGEQARCELLYITESMRKAADHFFLVSFHCPTGSGSVESDPVITCKLCLLYTSPSPRDS